MTHRWPLRALFALITLAMPLALVSAVDAMTGKHQIVCTSIAPGGDYAFSPTVAGYGGPITVLEVQIDGVLLKEGKDYGVALNGTPAPKVQFKTAPDLGAQAAYRSVVLNPGVGGFAWLTQLFPWPQ